MGTKYIEQTVADFLCDLDKIQSELTGFSRDLDDRSDKVSKLIEKFENQGIALAKKSTNEGKKANGVEVALQENLQAKSLVLQQWRMKVDEDRKGREFMHKHEKYLVVMVFGAVKSGKSTLGNFFGGRELRHASFDNRYQHIPTPVFESEEEGRTTGGLKQNGDNEVWFEEGVVDTTGSIQYFTLSGLRWMDSPGTGALGKSGDKRQMDDMVDEYIPYADMCIFLMNSGQPGLQEDMKYMEKMSREGQDAIIVITRSDTVEEDIDDDGNIVRVRMPKSKETRKMQENDICKRVLLAYPSIKEEQCRAISISSYLAKEGITKEDEGVYRDSHLDQLMKILGHKAAGDAAHLKEKRPRSTFNAFIDDVLGQDNRDDGRGSIVSLRNGLGKITDAILSSQKEMDKVMIQLIVDIKNETRRKFLEAANSWEKSVIKKDECLDGTELSKRVSRILTQVMQEKINKAISALITDYERQELKEVQIDFKSQGLKRKMDTITHEYTTVDYVERDAEGFIENVRGFFGKKYYRRVAQRRTESRSIDLGTNLEYMIDELLPQLEEQIKPIVQSEMQHLRASYFKPQEEYVQTMAAALKELQIGLENLKFTE